MNTGLTCGLCVPQLAEEGRTRVCVHGSSSCTPSRCSPTHGRAASAQGEDFELPVSNVHADLNCVSSQINYIEKKAPSTRDSKVDKERMGGSRAGAGGAINKKKRSLVVRKNRNNMLNRKNLVEKQERAPQFTTKPL